MAGPTTERTLWMLLAGNMLIGTGVFLPAGMLGQIAGAFGVGLAEAGWLILAGGLVVGFGAPLFAALTHRFDRRALLAATLVLYAAGHGASILAPGFGALVALRVLTLVSAAVFTPQAAATAGLLVPPERRSAAIAFIFIGWSVASVVGMPLSAYLAATLGWQAPYALMAALSLAGAAAVWRSVPPGLRVAPLDAAAWRTALTSPAILAVLTVTLLSASGQFTILSYFQPVMAEGFGATAETFSLTLAAFGVAGVLGNWLAARLVAPLGTERTIALALATMLCGLALFSVGYGVLAAGVAAACLWGLGTFSSNSLQQSRLAGLAPPIASATVALNTSAVYLGQACGAAAGGAVVAAGAAPGLGYVAAGFAAAGLALSLLASPRDRATR